MAQINEDAEVLVALGSITTGQIPAIRQLLDVKPPRCEFGEVAPPSDDAISLHLAQIGLMEAFIQNMFNAQQNGVLASNSAAVLMAMTVRSSTNQVSAGKLGCAQAVVTLLQQNDPTSSFWACGLLRNIARKDDNMTSIVEAGAIPMLFGLIQSKNILLQEAAAGAMWNTAWGGTIDIEEQEGFQHVIALLGSENEYIVNCGCSILMNVTMSCTPIGATKVIQAGAVPHLIRLLRHPNDKIQYSACGALSNLATTNNADELGNAGAIEPLIDLLSSTNDSVIESSSGALWNLCQSEANTDRVGANGITKLLAILSQNQAPGALENASGALAQLSLRVAMRPLIIEQNGLSVISNLFLRTDSDKVSITAAQVLYDLSWLPEGHAMIKQKPILAKFVQMLQNQSVDVQLAASTALFSPSYEPEVMDPLIPALAQCLLTTTSAQVLESLLECFLNFLPRGAAHLKPLPIQQKLGALLKVEAGSEVSGLAANVLSSLTEEPDFFRNIVQIYSVPLFKLMAHAETSVRAFYSLELVKAVLIRVLEQEECLIYCWKVVKHFHRAYYQQLEVHAYFELLHTLLHSEKEPQKAMATAWLQDIQAALREAPRLISIEPVSSAIDAGFLVNNKQYSDIILSINGAQIYAHRALLHSRSSYFRAMFESGMSETRNGQELVLMTDKPVSVWIEVMRFVYTDNCVVTGENVLALLEMADLYNMTKLTALCEKYLASTLSEDNIWSVYHLALQQNAIQLRAMCIQFIYLHVDLKDLSPQDLAQLRSS